MSSFQFAKFTTKGKPNLIPGKIAQIYFVNDFPEAAQLDKFQHSLESEIHSDKHNHKKHERKPQFKPLPSTNRSKTNPVKFQCKNKKEQRPGKSSD